LSSFGFDFSLGYSFGSDFAFLPPLGFYSSFFLGDLAGGSSLTFFLGASFLSS